MKKFLVRVNGQELEVEVEELIQTSVKKSPTSPKPSKQKTTVSGSGEVLSPMPGVISEIQVTVGEVVTADQPVVTLEAMKMENEIPAGKAGQVKEIHVSAGQTVSAGELLVVIE